MGAMYFGQTSPGFLALSIARTAAVEVFETTDRVPPIDSSSEEGIKPNSVKGHIEFNGLEFCYVSSHCMRPPGNRRGVVRPWCRFVGGGGGQGGEAGCMIERGNTYCERRRRHARERCITIRRRNARVTTRASIIVAAAGVNLCGKCSLMAGKIPRYVPLSPDISRRRCYWPMAMAMASDHHEYNATRPRPRPRTFSVRANL